MHEHQEFLSDKTSLVTTQNRIPGSVTPGTFVTDYETICYKSARGVFATVLDIRGQLLFARMLASPGISGYRMYDQDTMRLPEMPQVPL